MAAVNAIMWMQTVRMYTRVGRTFSADCQIVFVFQKENLQYSRFATLACMCLVVIADRASRLAS